MGLILKEQSKGKLRPNWYGLYFDANGKRRVVNLNVRWKGTPPESLRVSDLGNQAFERTRQQAQLALDAYSDEARRRGRADNLTERLIESKTGRQIEYTRISELAEKWRSIGRDSSPTERYLAACDAQFERFTDFMKNRKPSARYLYDVDNEDADAFVDLCRSVLAPSTSRDTIRLMSKAFSLFIPVGHSNPFERMFRRRSKGASGTVHRKPFTPDELRQLLHEAENDAFMHPLIVCAAMTGMRRGDVCNLKWEDIDLPGGMITVKTSKTDAATEIPIFPMLRQALCNSAPKRDGYVWPDAADMLINNPDGLTWRFKKIVARAFSQESNKDNSLADPQSVLRSGLAEIESRVEEPRRRARMTDTLRRYMDGKSVRQIETDTGIARATISNDLRTIEIWTELSFVRGSKGKTNIKQSIAQLTRKPRTSGVRAASVHDWHCLRVTWITFALAAGVPIELVRRVTGHTTVEVVLKHYFRPDREQFRAALASAMPDVMTGSNVAETTPEDELVALALKTKEGTATEADKRRMRLLAATI